MAQGSPPVDTLVKRELDALVQENEALHSALRPYVGALPDDRERAARVDAANEVRARALFSGEKLVDAYRHLYAYVLTGT